MAFLGSQLAASSRVQLFRNSRFGVVNQATWRTYQGHGKGFPWVKIAIECYIAALKRDMKNPILLETDSGARILSGMMLDGSRSRGGASQG